MAAMTHSGVWLPAGPSKKLAGRPATSRVSAGNWARHQSTGNDQGEVNEFADISAQFVQEGKVTNVYRLPEAWEQFQQRSRFPQVAQSLANNSLQSTSSHFFGKQDAFLRWSFVGPPPNAPTGATMSPRITRGGLGQPHTHRRNRGQLSLVYLSTVDQ